MRELQQMDPAKAAALLKDATLEITSYSPDIRVTVPTGPGIFDMTEALAGVAGLTQQ